MQLSRLWQPRNPVFWTLVAMSLLGAVFSWMLRSMSLNTLGLLLIGGMGLANALLSMWLAWQLVRDHPNPVNPANDRGR